jgi:hypothetical protein
MTHTLLLLLLVWGVFVAGRLSAPRRNANTPEHAAKQRQKAYVRWYEAQLREDERLRAKQDPTTYRPHAAVNLLSGMDA